MIVDVHAHLGATSRFYNPDASMEALLSLMDAVGIDLAVQMHIAGLLGCFEEAYEASGAAYERSSGRLPYCLVYDPRYVEDSLEWITKAQDHPGFAGIKIHPSFHQVFPEDSRYEPVWQFAVERGLPVITHSWSLSDYNPVQRFSTPEHFEHCVERFPQVNLILGHAGGRYEGHLAAVRLAHQYSNVYMDVSGDSYPLGFVEWLVAQVGAEHILFGSDLNWIDPRTHLGRVLDADITLDEKRLILGENACRLFKLTE